MPKSLTQILKTLPKTSTHLPNQTGLKPHLGEKGAKAWLAKHPVLDKGEPYDNDHTMGVKEFDRGAHRYGKDNVEFNDVNDKWGLSTSSIATEEKKYLRDIVEGYQSPFEKMIKRNKSKKGVSWNPPEVQAKVAKEKKERKMFASAKREINKLKRQGK